MRIPIAQSILRRSRFAAHTLVETLLAVVIFALVLAGILAGYVQANRFAEWSSMSLAAQSYALQGLEQVRAAKWDLSANPVADDIPAPTNYTQIDVMDVPQSGQPIYVTNKVSLTQITLPLNSAQLRMVRSDCIWTFRLTGQIFTNTVVSYRAPDKA